MQTQETVAILASAARTTEQIVDAATITHPGPGQGNAGWRGLIAYVDVTAASGTGGLTLTIEATFDNGVSYVPVLTAAVALITTGKRLYLIYPHADANSNFTEIIGGILPAKWRVKIAVGDASSNTYSVALNMLW